VGWAAGYGIRFVVVIQSISQLESVYGAETARGLVTNLGAQIIYAPREQRDADEYSKMLGETTVKRGQYTRNLGRGGGRSYTEIIDRRPLMNPDEIKALSACGRRRRCPCWTWVRKTRSLKQSSLTGQRNACCAVR
jgi:type IV secretion system protein VirD4